MDGSNLYPDLHLNPNRHLHLHRHVGLGHDGRSQVDHGHDQPIDCRTLLRTLLLCLDQIRPLLRSWHRKLSSTGVTESSGSSLLPPPKRFTMDTQTRLRLESLSGDVPSLVSALREWMQSQGSDLLDIFDQWDANDNHTISEIELERALASLGYRPPPLLARAIFDAIDCRPPYDLESASTSTDTPIPALVQALLTTCPCTCAHVHVHVCM